MFSNKLAKYNVALAAYEERLKPETNPSTSETEDDDRMDVIPGRADTFNAMLPPRPPPPRAHIQTTASSNKNKEFENTKLRFKSPSTPNP